MLNFPAEALFSVVLDVERYPEFLPWCKSVVVLSRKQEFMLVELVAGFMSLEGKYTSRVSYSAPSETKPGYIRARSEDGVFRSLNCEWLFTPSGNGATVVKFDVGFSFKSSVLQFAFDMASTAVKSHITSAFRKRAYQLLG
ncbi:type II toxin-antitoxin system RatA family toxin [Anaplasma platys]|uniref:Type II toxin-antitoxin system RatA family toxin n=1 Tax=Anaplasma platys TaxID=949 RepID=A0A858PXV0_9RICK|nr:type II toxin-antitoxin system RatA family toxin [Anaplasma platys]